MLDRVIGESLGTCIFSFIISVAQVDSDFTGNNGHEYSVGGGAIILMMLAGFSADPHLNPSITLGHLVRHFLYREFFDVQAILEHLLIILIQFISAFPGAYLGWALNNNIIYFAPTFQASQSQVFVAEIVFTCLITTTALMIGKTKDSRILGCIGLGAAYFSGVACVSYYSGGCFNPAIGLAINTVKYTQDSDHFSSTWIYIVAPSIGGVLGGFINSIFLMGGKQETNVYNEIALEYN
jgi:glycerol uptake facilitator-like aquaporin